MRVANRYRIGSAVIGTILSLGVPAAAQDPAVVNARTIQVKLENPRVRVMEATLEPGAKEQIHSHPGYVVYVLAGGKVRNHGADGKTNDTEFKAGEVYWRDPLTHWAENVGTTTMRFLLVEVKEPTK